MQGLSPTRKYRSHSDYGRLPVVGGTSATVGAAGLLQTKCGFREAERVLPVPALSRYRSRSARGPQSGPRVVDAPARGQKLGGLAESYVALRC